MASAPNGGRAKGADISFLVPTRSELTDGPLKTKPFNRAKSHHLATAKPPSRAWLVAQARFWRFLMAIGMDLHGLQWPRARRHSFVKHFPAGPVGSGSISLYFYVPPDYCKKTRAGHRYPLVVNFHGGGFVTGTPTDDKYWATCVLQNVDCVIVSVGYRLAPEHPFPVPLDDCVDALLYLASNAAELGIDPSRTALSGFSAGANLAFATPLRLKYHTQMLGTEGPPTDEEDASRWPTTQRLLSGGHDLKFVAIVAWYPILNFTESRACKTRRSVRPSKVLSRFFTDLFDHSYLPAPDLKENAASSYASPGLASADWLIHALPDQIHLYLCEYDMLLYEGQRFSERLESIGKTVETRIIPGVPHGWDKSVNPFRDQGAINALYAQACAFMMECFGQNPSQVHQKYTLEPCKSGANKPALAKTQIPRKLSAKTNMPL